MAEATLESFGSEADEAAGRAERRQAAKRQAAKASRQKAREADEVAYRAQRARWERERPGNKRQRAAAAAPGTARSAGTQQVKAACPNARLQHFLLLQHLGPAQLAKCTIACHRHDTFLETILWSIRFSPCAAGLC
jgi:hypothetical protein